MKKGTLYGLIILMLVLLIAIFPSIKAVEITHIEKDSITNLTIELLNSTSGPELNGKCNLSVWEQNETLVVNNESMTQDAALHYYFYTVNNSWSEGDYVGCAVCYSAEGSESGCFKFEISKTPLSVPTGKSPFLLESDFRNFSENLYKELAVLEKEITTKPTGGATFAVGTTTENTVIYSILSTIGFLTIVTIIFLIIMGKKKGWFG